MKRQYTLLGIAALLLLLAACSPAATPAPANTPAPAAVQATATRPPAPPPTNTAAPAPTNTAVPAPTATSAPKPTEAPKTSFDASKIGQELVDAYAGKFKGTKVTMTGPFAGEDAVKFNATMKSFMDATGIQVQYEGSKEFEATITARVEGGSPPDIADFPQPGLLASIAKTGKVVDINKVVKADWLKANYNPSLLDIATVQGKDAKIMDGVWHRVNGKSLVWYPKAAFDKAGYKIPQTWDDMLKLMDQIVKDGDAPWCIGIESGAATGWAATDWMEDIMLRTTSLENYDKWTSGALPFTSPEVKNAAKLMSNIWFNDKYVYGGRKAIVSTGFGDAPKPMFTTPTPKCWLHRQGNFITSFFPQNAKAGTDYDVFYLPPIDAKYGKPFLFAGDLMAMFNDRPEVRAVMQYFTTGAAIEGWAKAGGAIAIQKDSKLEWYPNDIDRKVAQFILQADSLRFDGSDLMPGVVGAGTFWKGMTNYVSGQVDLDKAMEEIQAGWNQVKK